MATFNPNGRKRQPEPYPSVWSQNAEILRKYQTENTTAKTSYPGGITLESPAIGSTPYEPTPPPSFGSEPFPDVATEVGSDNEKNYQPPPSSDELPPGASDEPDDWKSEMDARMAALDANKEEINAIRAQADAAINRGQIPAAQAPAAQEATVKPPAPKSAFTPGVGFTNSPITFKSPGGVAWKEGDEVGFNSAKVEMENPGWTGGASWASRASMGGGYNGSVMANPEERRAPSKQTRDFYQRADDRGDTRRVNRFNARMGR